MKDLELSPRLAAVAAQVPEGARPVDVGTDHAYLPVWLIQQKRVASAIASDLREGPLSRGKQVASTYGVSSQLSFRCCDGLHGIASEEVDTILIAGMGGETIAAILEAAPWTRLDAPLLLLQPMSAVPDLRLWLSQNGFSIQREEIVPEGNKFYIILTVRAGKMEPLHAGELWGGRQSREQPAPYRLAYLNQVIQRRERALQGMEQAARSLQTLAETRETLRELYQLREEWIAWQR